MDHTTASDLTTEQSPATGDSRNVTCLIVSNDEFESEGLRGLLANRGINATTAVADPSSLAQLQATVEPGVILLFESEVTAALLTAIGSKRQQFVGSKIILIFDASSLAITFRPKIKLSTESGFREVKPILRSSIRDGDRMAALVEKVLGGNDSVESDVVDILVRSAVDTSESLRHLLTNRELVVLELAGQGAANKSIARQLGLSPIYTGVLLSQIFAKLGLQNDPETNPRVAACRRYFLEYGLDKTD
jgi:serine/threonine-protein kinase